MRRDEVSIADALRAVEIVGEMAPTAFADREHGGMSDVVLHSMPSQSACTHMRGWPGLASRGQ